MKILPLLFFAVLAFVISAPLRADEYEARTFAGADGTLLGFRLLKPKDYDAAKKYPLVLVLHGAGERGTDNAVQLKYGAPLFLKPEVRDKYPCFVVAPQCPPDQTWSAVKGWTGPNAFEEEPTAPMKLVLGALDGLLKEFPVDQDRLYVTGLSMGGYGTWDLLTRQPQRWAAAAPICGGGDASRIAPAKGVAVWAFHGVLDPTVPVVRTREMIAALEAAGGKPLYSEYPYVKHDSWNIAYGEPELLPWMFAQRRGAVVAWDKVAGPFSQPPSNLCPGAGPMQSGLWFRTLWKGRREQWSTMKTTEANSVVFFGDSITQGWGSLAKDFPNLKVSNRGISGDTTRGLRARLQGDVLDLHPKAVSILIGTNDLDQGGEPEVVVENLKAIVSALHAADPKMPVVINKVMPRGPKPDLFPDKIRRLNALYEEAFKNDAQVCFCDTWALFDDGNGSCKKEEFPDMLHPNASGYAKWTTALQPIFDRLGLTK
ncbi:MAG: GDSL-type esterase/lipase family protein [Chthoniobacter sp.]|uniref:GDSL-type esterase/lipase family protein n=1 Tax=Chthoniobacter sp. TaxID=2510640 RepID=UPI0032A670E4